MPTPTEHPIASLYTTILYILGSILRSTVGVISANAPKVCAPYTPEIIHFPLEILTCCIPYWGELLVQFQRMLQKCAPRTHLKSFIFLWKSLHVASHTEVHSWCNSSESAPRTHLKSFVFLWKSWHFASHTEVHSWCNFSECSKSVRPVHTWNRSFSFGNPNMLHPILRSTLGVISANAPKVCAKSLHVASHTEVHSWCNSNESSKSVRPVHTWNHSFSFGNLNVLHPILRSTLGAISANAPKVCAPYVFHGPSAKYATSTERPIASLYINILNILGSILRYNLGSDSARPPNTSHPQSVQLHHSAPIFSTFWVPYWCTIYGQIRPSANTSHPQSVQLHHFTPIFCTFWAPYWGTI